VLSSIPSPPGCLRATSDFIFFWRREGQQQMNLRAAMQGKASQWQQSSRQGHGCTQCACSHSGFSTTYPPVGCTGGMHGSGVDGRSRRRNAGRQAVCACLWRADACAQCVPVARTACVRYASCGQRGVDGRIRRRKPGRRAVCVCLWRADACAQGVPVARTACVRYASSSGRG